MRFEFATATRIIFGDGVVAELPDHLEALGRRVLIVTGADPSRCEPHIEALRKRGLVVSILPIGAEPTTGMICDGVTRAREFACEVIVGIGGGSPIDAGKAIAILLANSGDPLDYLEVVGIGKSLTEPSVPYVAIPTTAGTGSEVTRNAVLTVESQRIKVSLRSALMLPRLALIDPVLSHTMPPKITASTGLDALTQVIEPFVSNANNPLVDGMCREGMFRAARSLRRAYENGEDAQARCDMSITSLLGGLALANAKLGAIHGLAGPAGGMFDVPHGILCARFLPLVMEANVKALLARAPESPILPRFDEVAKILSASPKARAEDGVSWLSELCGALTVPGLGEYGMTSGCLEILVDRAAVASSMKGNPIELTRDELLDIVYRAL